MFVNQLKGLCQPCPSATMETMKPMSGTIPVSQRGIITVLGIGTNQNQHYEPEKTSDPPGTNH